MVKVGKKRQCAENPKGNAGKQIQKEKPKPKKSIKGKITMVDNIVGKTFREGFAWYLVVSGSKKGWMRSDKFTLKGTPTAKLYLKAFVSGVNFGSDGAEEEDVEDPSLIQKIEKEFMDQGGYYDPDEYCVGNILSKRGKRGHEEYLVKWIGYPREEATWEPKDCLENSKTMVRIFESGIKVGKMINDHVNTVIDNILEF